MKTPRTFANALASTSLKAVFNPYSDHCALYDRIDAAHVRKRNLIHCLEAAIEARVDTIWIARDLGYRGGRRTGVPLTDEIHLTSASTLMGGVALDRATHGPAVAERTAAVVWRVLTRVGAPVVLWNIFPLHPHEDNNPLTNRCHSRAERDATWPFLTALISMVAPRRIIAIGRDASLALAGINTPVMTVRHPSYGGQTEFIAGVHAIYGLVNDDVAPELPLASHTASGTII
ncbi:uracil-DNA glycosylase [Roseomonas populi]|uniref:Uracil-DNA glycosylase n=1 Tax=Roseomonas populi TaxID=3121582 RepID=A0ABT1X7F3_9PROT|nr:uracil-DNA glycosylase [Roseomonas pecuniae]MCR0984038.1 uracil-DNA glycosylase [Roseomonas pecuniae]